MADLAPISRVLARTMGPVLRARGPMRSAFLRPGERSHAEAMGARGDGHWERLVDSYGLAGAGTVLDVACGSGDWLAPLARVNTRVVGTDIDEGMLAHARERAGVDGVEIRTMRAEELDFPAASFDAVACMSALPYLDQPLALAEFARVLKPGGRIVVGTVGSGYYAQHVVDGIRHDDREAIGYGLDALLVTAGRRVRGRGFAAGSLQAWSPRTVRGLLGQAGFDVDRIVRDVDAADPDWPKSCLGLPTYFVVLATRRGQR